MTKMKNEISDAYSKGYSTALEHLEKQQTFFKQFMMPPAPSSLNMMHLHSSAGSSSSLPGGSRMTSPNTFNSLQLDAKRLQRAPVRNCGQVVLEASRVVMMSQVEG